MKSKYLALCALFAALTAICAWLSIPTGSISFTMQSFSVALCLLLLGGKWGSLSVFVYLLLGLVGLPVFSGFRGGAGMLVSASGGYLLGFLVWALVYWLITSVFGKKSRLSALIVGQLVCYAFGTAWMWQIYLRQGGSGSLLIVALGCVVPYLLPDAVKIALAWFLAKRLKPRLS